MSHSSGFVPTRPLPAALTLEQFREAVNSSFVPLEVTSESPDTFRGFIARASVHGISFTDVRATAQVVQRTLQLIENDPKAFFKISLQLEGHGIHRQHGREVDLQPGDLVIYDTTHPYELEFTDRFRVIVVMLPHDRLKIPAARVQDITATRLAGTEGLGRVVSPFLATLGTNLDELRGPAGVRLAQNALHLLDTLFSYEFDLAKLAADPRRALMERIRDDIDRRLGDPDLTPKSIAENAFISVRHLHSLFSDEGETVSSYVRSRRLERTYLDLTDPQHAALPVAAIGERWGFHSPTHFSRTFKLVYGESPSEVRRRALD